MVADVQPAVPTFDQLLWPAIKTLKAMGGCASNEELLAKIFELEGIPESVQTYTVKAKAERQATWALLREKRRLIDVDD
jgi:hypothetical protein